MYPIPPTETLVQTKTCRHCSALFPITDKDLEFYEKVSPVFNGKKYSIPTSTLCPDCRQQRRLSFRNERKLYKRKCDATNKDIISIYSPDKPFKVYHQDYWWSDKWDPMEYGRDFDVNRGFFEQFGEMMGEVPKIAIMNDDGVLSGSENCAYCQDFSIGKNCYLFTSSWYVENGMYSDCCIRVKDIVDCISTNDSENVYECMDCSKITNGSHLSNCHSSQNCEYSRDLIGCSDCFLCSWLQNSQYCIRNTQYSKSDYFEIVTRLKSSGQKALIDEYRNLWKICPVKCNATFASENAIGNNIFFSKNTIYGFDIADSSDLRYCFRVNTNARDCMDVHQSWSPILVYEGLTPDKTNLWAFLTWCWEGCSAIYLSDTCITCANCFWCIGLRNKQYCILNKQYTKEEYEALVPRIIEHMMSTGEWGEFFPSSLSPFGYNETVAQEYYPLTREEVLSPLSSEGEGSGVRFNWSDYEPPFPRVEKIIPADKLPDDISKIPDDILNWAIECEVTKKPFRIIKQELEFYRKHHLPIPRRHPDQRHLDRMALRNPRKLFERKCDKCGVDMVTTYSPERKEVVYCESCYNAEVVW